MKTSSVSNSANQQFFGWLTKQILSARQQIWLFLVSTLCQQFYSVSKFISRHQQHDYSAGISSFTLARQSTEMISLLAGALLVLFCDSPRIAGPSYLAIHG
jgi:hypothetical protein